MGTAVVGGCVVVVVVGVPEGDGFVGGGRVVGGSVEGSVAGFVAGSETILVGGGAESGA